MMMKTENCRRRRHHHHQVVSNQQPFVSKFPCVVFGTATAFGMEPVMMMMMSAVDCCCCYCAL